MNMGLLRAVLTDGAEHVSDVTLVCILPRAPMVPPVVPGNVTSPGAPLHARKGVGLGWDQTRITGGGDYFAVGYFAFQIHAKFPTQFSGCCAK